MNKHAFDVIIIGGSYAGLSAAMALGRSLKHVLVIDSGTPCNRQTPHSHNFITQDGATPAQIAALAKAEVLKYDTIRFCNALATAAVQTANGFEVTISTGQQFAAKKLLFATGVNDQMPGIHGFAECWGISVLHCPYCHGYEVKNAILGLIGNGDAGYELCKLISNWSRELILFTNGPSTLTEAQQAKLTKHHIAIIETPIDSFQHNNGYIHHILLQNGTLKPVDAVFARVPFQQQCLLPQYLGCEITETGHIKTDDFQKTTVPGIYAAGDNATMYRSVPAVVAAGSKAGAFINKELIEDFF